MADARDDTPFADVQDKLKLIGKAVEGAIEKISGDMPYVFCLFVIDPTQGKMAFTTNANREQLYPALVDWLHRQGH